MSCMYVCMYDRTHVCMYVCTKVQYNFLHSTCCNVMLPRYMNVCTVPKIQC